MKEKKEKKKKNKNGGEGRGKQNTTHMAPDKGDRFRGRNASFGADFSTIILGSTLFSMLGKLKV